MTAADGHEYDKSATANATVAPTNEATIAKQQELLAQEWIQFVTIVDYEWNLKKLSDERLIEEYGYTLNEINANYSNPTVIGALAERGIDVQHIRPDSNTKHAKLSPVQLIVANRLLDLTDNRSDRKKIQDSGISTLQYNAWLADPEFTKYLRDRAEGLLGSSQHEILLALMDKVKSRDTSAIKLALELTGRYTPQTSGNSAGPSQHDVSSIITRVVEIIIDEVEDKPTAMRIAERLQGLVIGAQVAGTMATPVAKPEIAAPREITPEVKVMMDKGLGYDN